MRTYEEVEQQRRSDEAKRVQKIRDDALTADLSHAKDKAEEDRIRQRYNDETAAAQAGLDEAERASEYPTNACTDIDSFNT